MSFAKLGVLSPAQHLISFSACFPSEDQFIIRLAKFLQTKYEANVKSELEKYFETYKNKESESFWFRLDFRRKVTPFLEKALSERQKKLLLRDFILSQLPNVHTILFDFPDYSLRNMKQMDIDLHRFDKFWNRYICRDIEGENFPVEANVVVFFQKELFDVKRHFILGKFDVYKLNPSSPKEMVSFYKTKFGSTNPFDKDALLKIARLSKGIWRKFKRYIRICLDHSPLSEASTKETITLKDVSCLITDEQLIEDRKLELQAMFPRRRELREFAVEVCKYIPENSEILQSEILQEVFNNNKVTASRVLNRMEEFNWIGSRRVGKEKKWHLL